MRHHLSGIVLGFAVLVLTAGDVLAHSGGTNATGCHTNRRTGDYHCHRPRSQSSGRVTYCHVVRGGNRCGYALSTCNGLVSSFGGYCVRRQ